MTDPTRPRRWPYVVPVLLLALLVAAGWGAYGLGWVDHWRGADAPPPPKPARPLVFTPLRPGPTAVAAAAPTGPLQPAAIRAALARPLADRKLGRHVLTRVAPLSGSPVFTSGTGDATPASITKLLTTTAALETLGPDHRFATIVTRQGSTLTLVGGGDALLDSDDLAGLAKATAAKLRAVHVRRVRLAYDASLFTGPPVNPHWLSEYLPEEIVPVSALSVDDGHTPGPDGKIGTDDDDRTMDPAGTAAAVFAAKLKAAGIAVAGTPRPGRRSGAAIASVANHTVGQIVEHTLEVSDNQMAENLARHVGLASGDGSFTGAVSGVVAALGKLGVPASGIHLYDGSGLSRQDRIDPAVIVKVLQLDASPDHPELSPVLSGLPVAGFSGSLATRFQSGPATAGLGVVRAKTGTLSSVSGLAGIVIDRRGTPMIVVAMADRFAKDNTLDVRQRLEEILAAVASCVCS